MVKDDKDVIAEFNEYVNMTASELEKWLKSEESNQAGWRKDGEDGKSVGQDSGEKIIEILKANPDKDPEKYTEDQIQHMRKVASYCKRHLAQETGSLEEKDPEEAKKTKSYISLKNWGHDPLKEQNGGKSSSKSGSKPESKSKDGEADDDGKEEKADDVAEGEGDEEDVGEDDKKTGDKRKKSGSQNGSNKKRETRQGASSKKDGEEDADEEDEDAEGDGENGGEEEGGGESGGKKPSKNGPAKGETVSWKWGSGNPEGKVLDVKEDEATIKTKRGNEVSRKGDPEDPAVILDTGKSKAIKSAHELN
ncbi:hypothetical protein KVR01_013095 [Diaporthe batatas]|uniref:uncharacterized protein n=1 Tax=Diaporthe batatas TaxID=748121 RepID=UPI001D04B4BD|nr:uncharacterized protein KVR01_013095 [Diaporthe batatas]KAG8157105.1 hypothetical protein KVR01_013095 [Diaporthe batatas]